ncbi:phosphate ABC transporter permease PstA [Psychromonas sp. Urea-02u-13]|uniref:phosphate ABC transporter permease PstA n=1 Tax=Psychromonas sp. Urea-02u-13 TaxID=2058326 RepID=UPI000C31FEF4|nr:phosphate ABC transporter permease PstA [Psychromonas sp. Urea-02u-13]PKG37886.1 phosphate ABC transporter, permease protein PstA [Psychromonas sp. Urea-02u-13]
MHSRDSQLNNARVVNHTMTIIIWSVALSTMLLPLSIISDVFIKGLAHLNWSFLTEIPKNSGREGGISSLFISNSLILIVCLAVVIPIGITTALYLNERVSPNDKVDKWIQISLDVLAGVPSIIFGLFGYVFFCQILGLGFSILSGGLSLACMVLPLFIRLCENNLKNSPASYREAAEALNISHTGFIIKVLLPSVAEGIGAAVVVVMGRALAETAVLIFTAGYALRYPNSLFDSGRSLSIHIYDLAMNVPGGMPAASATAIVLFLLLIILNALVRFSCRRL